MSSPITGDRVAIITGASSGIGRRLAVRLAARGTRVGLIARRAALLQDLQAEIVDTGGKAETACVDVSDAEATAEAVQELRARLGPMDWVVANAGFAPPESVTPLNTADIRQMMQVNYLGVVHTFAAALPAMLERGAGQLAAVSSLAAYKGFPSAVGYSASKAAVNTFLEGLRIELIGTGVKVTTICPGFIDTPMTAHNHGAMPWLMSADEAAKRIIRALERGGAVENFPWQTTLMVKLARLCPDWLVGKLSPREIPGSEQRLSA